MRDHFVPRHYLRCFTIQKSERIAVSQVDPYRFVGIRGVGGQCQQDDFYEGNKALDKILQNYENRIAPILVQVVQKEGFTEPDLVDLRWLAASLHLRTKRAAEAYKVLPKRIFFEFVQSGIDSGALPPPPDGEWKKEMVDCRGASAFILQNGAISCALEMHTLGCKLLKADQGCFFVTSDNPAVLLNQFCIGADRFRSFAGFGKSGFQLLLPISPKLCLMFYDPKVYKVEGRRQRLVLIPKSDVEIVNSLQVQFSDKFVYFHDPKCEPEVREMLAQHAKLRMPVEDHLRTIPTPNPKEELLHFRQMSGRLPRMWTFCHLLRNIAAQVGQRRDPVWTAAIDALMEDIHKNPSGGELSTRMERILADPNALLGRRVPCLD